MKRILVSMLIILLSSLVVGCNGFQPTEGGITYTHPTSPSPISQSRTLTVEPGESRIVFISVNAGDRLKGSFSIEGGSGDDVIFSVKDPLANLILDQGRVSSSWQFDFVCTSTGSYQLIFDNGFSLFSNKVVGLTTTVYPKE